MAQRTGWPESLAGQAGLANLPACAARREASPGDSSLDNGSVWIMDQASGWALCIPLFAFFPGWTKQLSASGTTTKATPKGSVRVMTPPTYHSADLPHEAGAFGPGPKSPALRRAGVVWGLDRRVSCRTHYTFPA